MMNFFPPLPRRLFLIAAAVLLHSDANSAVVAPEYGDNVQFRVRMDHSWVKFRREHKGTVAFIGGSITEMNGYRPMVSEGLQKRFPGTAFKFINAGISSTCSTTGAFRLATDVFGQGPVDLLFVEFAVNDDQDAAHTRAECVRGMEGIIRHARQLNPDIDIVMTYFVNEGMLKTLQSGGTPLTIEAHEAVAKHYGVSTIHLAKEVAGEITAGKLTWKQYGGVHPAPFGNAIAAGMIEDLLWRAWSPSLSADATPAAHVTPSPLDSFHYGNGRFIDPKEAKVKGGWTLGIPDWKALAGGKRERFTSIPLLSATEPGGAEATLEFEGNAVGAYVVAGPDAGIAEASIDGGPFHAVNLLHRFSAGLHYPRTVMLGTELKPGKHVLTLRISPETKGTGHAMRVVQFVAN